LKEFNYGFLILAIITASVALAAQHVDGSKQSKWTEFNDPYGRYTIEYPSKWKVQNEGVHTYDFTREVPFEVCGTHDGITNQCLLVSEFANAEGFGAREIASNFLNSIETLTGGSQVIEPITCDNILALETCTYAATSGVGLFSQGWFVYSFVDSAKNAYIVAYKTYTDEGRMSPKDLAYMMNSFKILNTLASEGTSHTDTTSVGSNHAEYAYQLPVKILGIYPETGTIEITSKSNSGSAKAFQLKTGVNNGQIINLNLYGSQDPALTHFTTCATVIKDGVILCKVTHTEQEIVDLNFPAPSQIPTKEMSTRESSNITQNAAGNNESFPTDISRNKSDEINGTLLKTQTNDEFNPVIDSSDKILENSTKSTSVSKNQSTDTATQKTISQDVSTNKLDDNESDSLAGLIEGIGKIFGNKSN
jgi:hypothetical protein